MIDDCCFGIIIDECCPGTLTRLGIPDCLYARLPSESSNRYVYVASLKLISYRTVSALKAVFRSIIELQRLERELS